MATPPIHRILWDRDQTWERILVALAEERGFLDAAGRIPQLHYKVQDEARR